MGLKSTLKHRLNASQFTLMQNIRYEIHLQVQSLLNTIIPSRRKAHSDMQQMQDIKLHWGCGGKRRDGWLNIDGWGTPATDYVFDMRNTLPLKDNSVELIFTEHVLEHFYHADAKNIMADFYRVLKPGGTARIIIPSLEIFAQKYVEKDPKFMREDWNTCENDGEILNCVFFEHFHRTIFDFEMMKNDLQRAGFSQIRKAGFRDSPVDALNIDSDDGSRLECSLYVEATK